MEQQLQTDESFSPSKRDEINQQEHKTKVEKDEDDDDLEGEEEKIDQPKCRQDLYVCFTNDKDLRHHETISIKAAMYKGIAIKVKILNHIWIENILFSIESAPDLGIINLRFEECRLLKKAVQRLIEFCKTSTIIESLSLFKTTFDDGQDFKRLVEAISFNNKIKQFAVQSADFDEDYHGKTMSRCILESRSLMELDLSYVTFEDPKSFYEMANGLLNERCRLGALKLRGIAFGQLEGKVMQFILMRNKSLQTLDISQCSTDSPENLENVFCKFDSFCNLRTLIAENLNADFNYVVEIFGEAIGGNTKMEGLSIKENKLKQTQYCNFWELMQENRSLKKMNVSKTDITDKVCAKISQYLQQPELKLHDLNLSRNQIAADGLVCIAEALMVNTSLTILNLAQNLIREGGIPEFVEALKKNKTIQELCLSFNKINNNGMSALSGFLEENKSIKVLDVSRNVFSDLGFCDFARQLANNKGIESLNLSKNKDVSDEVGLKELAAALVFNSSLAVIDLSGLKVRKPCVFQYFQPALKSNITLKRIIGKIPPGIIGDDLKDNVTIEAEILSKYKTVLKDNKRELRKLPLHRVDGDQTQLNLRDQPNELLTPALKFIRFRNIHVVDLSNMQLEDESLRQLALYLEENPVVRSLALAQNNFTDDGLAWIISALKKNTNLNHLNIISCANISDQSLRALEDMITKVNMSLYAIEIDLEKFDPDLIDSILDQAAMNRAIQEHLKPIKVNQNGLAEIQFQKNAAVAKYFDSAIKAWRILSPSFIRVVNEGLEDQHVEKLCAFLSGKNLIQSLNLRRNKIGDKGALAIAEYIRKSDKTLTSLELERNLIQDEGGEALLKAMQTNMRMEVCQMAYGNPLRQKICRQIEREIKANLQIKQTVVPRYKANNNSLVSYEESDRGPDFVRCALKSCELFKILHLSLPDNMIGEKEMQDIAYVLSRNTPLKTLNLSNNAVDAKAAVVLADALGYNSHLKELDLRNNKLGDAGIAILMEPFISQILVRNLMIEEGKKNNQPVMQSADDHDNPVLSNDSIEPKTANRKLKMKIQKLSIDKNQQTNEALKHIYTVLLGNLDIEISIDLPDPNDQDLDKSSNASLNEDDGDSNGLLSPRNIVVPINTVDKNDNSQDDEEEFNSLKNMDDDEDQEQMKHDKPVVPGICKGKMCRPCRKLCYRPKGSKPKTCIQVFFPSLFYAKSIATQFKISWNFVESAEKGIQSTIFYCLVSIYFFYFILAIVLPFVIKSDDKIMCTQQLPITVYAGYGAFLAISYIVEVLTYLNLKTSLKLESGTSILSCNSYLLVKQFQGQLANLDTYVHVCYIASVVDCHFKHQMDLEQAEGKTVRGVSIFLAVLTILILVISNIRRVKFIWQYKKPQPEIHRLMPNTFRNIQIAWICNSNFIAVILESTSLTEYMFENGGPIVPGKEKYLGDNKKQQVISIQDILTKDKMMQQDLPMLIILVIALLANMFSERPFDIVGVAKIAVTALSLSSNYLSLKAKRDQSGVDKSIVMVLIRDRMDKANLKRDQVGLQVPVAEAKEAKASHTQISIRDTDRSDEKSFEMENGQEDFNFTQAANKLNQAQQPTLKLGKKDDGGRLVNFEDEMKGLPVGSINDSMDDAGAKSVSPPKGHMNTKIVNLDVVISKVDLR